MEKHMVSGSPFNPNYFLREPLAVQQASGTQASRVGTDRYSDITN